MRHGSRGEENEKKEYKRGVFKEFNYSNSAPKSKRGGGGGRGRKREREKEREEKGSLDMTPRYRQIFTMWLYIRFSRVPRPLHPIFLTTSD